MARQSLSKKTRFEIFKRDKFTCQYCGGQPPDVVLVVDHIHPVAHGGDNDMMNLITSCEPCNQGKGARPLERVAVLPDADIEWLEMQQEIVELRRYQTGKAERDRVRTEVIKGFQNLWWDNKISGETAPSNEIFDQWLTWASPEQIEKAIKVTASQGWRLYNFNAAFKYCCGVLHNLVVEGT